MSRTLCSVIALQDGETTAVATAQVDVATRRRRLAIGFARPLGMRLLSWCDRHPQLVGMHGDLVDDLRRALNAGERIAALVTAIYSEIPEAMEAES